MRPLQRFSKRPSKRFSMRPIIPWTLVLVLVEGGGRFGGAPRVKICFCLLALPAGSVSLAFTCVRPINAPHQSALQFSVQWCPSVLSIKAPLKTACNAAHQ